MEEWFSRFFQNLQLQLGLRDPKLTAPEKNISGIFLETDTGENIDILLVDKDGRVEELRGRTPDLCGNALLRPCDRRTALQDAGAKAQR